MAAHVVVANVSATRRQPLLLAIAGQMWTRQPIRDQSPAPQYTLAPVPVVQQRPRHPPDLIAAAIYGMLIAAVDAGVHATPAPPPAGPAAAPPLAPAAPAPAAKAPPVATAPPRRPKAAKASPPPARRADVEVEDGPHLDVAGFADAPDAPDAPPAPLARRMNGNEHNPEAEARARWLEHMARVQS
jgi:hypothetical protein